MNRRKKITILCLILFQIILLVSSLTIVSTMARQFTSTSKYDSAKVAEFNIEIAAPEELVLLSEENPFQHLFTGKGQTISFDFSITNSDEVIVICTPYFHGDVSFNTIVNEKVYDSFIVGIGETVDFTIVVISDGLRAEALATNLVINVEQL